MGNKSELQEKLEEREAELSVINSVQEALVEEMDMQDIYDLVGGKIQELFDAQVVLICTFDHDKGLEHFHYRYEDGKSFENHSRPLDNFRKRLIETQELMLINEDFPKEAEKILGKKPKSVEGSQLPKSVLFVPMVIDKTVKGYVSLQNLDREHAFASSDVQLLRTLVNSMSVALENARLFNETEQRNAELAVINRVQEGLVAEMDMQGIYDLVGDKIRDLFDGQVTGIVSIDQEKKMEYFEYIFEEGERIYPDPRRYDKLRSKLISNKKPIVINEDYLKRINEINQTSNDPRAVSGTQNPKSAIYVPMVVGDKVLGYVSIQNIDREFAFSESDVDLLSTLVNSMSVAIENARLFNETTRLLSKAEQQATELRTVNSISKALVSQLELDALVKLVGDQMQKTFEADIVYLALHDQESDMLNFPYYYGDKTHSRPFGNGITEKIILSKEPILINQDLENRYDEIQAEKKGEMVESYLGVPIVAGEEAIGVISVQSKEEENRFSEDDQRLLNTIAANVGVAMQNAEAYQDLQEALNELQSAQEQLIQQEKLASLGQLTAGIAHEIKNPLNFVTNFSELSIELVEEIRDELSVENETHELVLDILVDVERNLSKINEHGTRADGIVKSMLQHSRGGGGTMEPTDLNAVIEEYVNLAFHGMRAGPKRMNVDIDLQLSDKVGEVSLISEDFSRVIVNICNNAFDAMWEKKEESDNGYEPKLTVRTKWKNNNALIEIEDNGPGIPQEIKENIMQPFFTTKKGTDGTGLGLSITNDIIKAHGGSVEIETKEDEFTRFKILIQQ